MQHSGIPGKDSLAWKECLNGSVIQLVKLQTKAAPILPGRRETFGMTFATQTAESRFIFHCIDRRG